MFGILQCKTSSATHQAFSQFYRPRGSYPGGQRPHARKVPSTRKVLQPAERNKVNRTVINLIAVAERSERGYVDVPPGSVNDEIESELAELGYAVSFSDRLWLGGFRIYSPESIQAGNYRPHVPPSIFTCASSQSARVPDARDFDLNTVLDERGERPSN